MNDDLYRRTFRRGLFDFHAGEAVPEVALDVGGYIAAAAEAGMQTITFMAKDAFGNSYYETKVGHKNAKIAGDPLAEAVREAKAKDIAILAYYNVGLNSHVARDNPDYRQRTADGQPVAGAFDYYDILCMNSPYRDFVFAQLTEIATQYEVVGFFFDITYVWEGCCHCEYCDRQYREAYGRPIPVSPEPGSREAEQWQSFGRDIRRRFLRDTAGLLKRIDPGLLIGWNHAGDPLFGQTEADEYADYLTSEFHPPHYMYGSLLARWKRSFGKPFELMMPSEMGSWGEWTVAPAATLRATAAIAVANGGSISFGHVAYPSGLLKGQVPRPVMDAIREANAFVERLEPWLRDAASEPMVAVLHDIGNKRMMEASALSWSAGHAHLQGLHRMLTEGHIHHDLVDERVLLRDIDRYELVILPDQAWLSEPLQARIREYVRGGGRVLATGRTSLYGRDGARQADFGLADLLGVRFRDYSVYSCSYLYPVSGEIGREVPDLPILLKEPDQTALRVEPGPDTRVLCGTVDPAVEAKAHRHVYHQHAHPAHATPYPAVTLHAFGSGACAYIAGPIEASYWSTGSPWLRNLYLNVLSVLNPEPRLEVGAPPSVEVNVMRQRSRLIVHLIQIREEKAAGSKTFLERAEPACDVTVAVRCRATRVYTVPDGAELVFGQTDGRVTFTVPRVELHTAVAVELE